LARVVHPQVVITFKESAPMNENQNEIEKGDDEDMPQGRKDASTPGATDEDDASKHAGPPIKDEIKHAPGKPLGTHEKLREGEVEKLDGSERHSG
jgi:hypothetical protein